MERHAIRRCLGACLLGSALATGCSQTGSRVEDPPPWVAHPYGRPTVYRPAVAQRPVEQPQARHRIRLPAFGWTAGSRVPPVAVQVPL